MIEFDEEEHRYTVNGHEVPSVTQLIKGLFPMSPFIKAEVLSEKARLGKAVHAAIQLRHEGDLDYDSLHPAVKPYLDSWIAFEEELGVEVLACEERVFSVKHQFAGTLDILAKLRTSESTYILDVKTGLEYKMEHRLQTALYSMAKEGDFGRGAVYLTPGGWDFRDHSPYSRDDYRAALGLLALSNWKRTL